MKVLVTGGAGYIGSVLTAGLLDRGYQVTVLDNFYFNQISLNHLCHCKNLEIVFGDVRDEHLVRTLIEDKDLIIPLAAMVGAPLCEKDPFSATSINRESILQLIQ